MTDSLYSYCLAVSRAKNIARQADIVAALTLEVLQGSVVAYDTGMYHTFSVTQSALLSCCQMYTVPGHTMVSS